MYNNIDYSSILFVPSLAAKLVCVLAKSGVDQNDPGTTDDYTQSLHTDWQFKKDTELLS